MSCGIKVPGAVEPFFVDTLAADTIWFHVYSTESHANTPYTFARGWGDTRFAPIKDGGGIAVHTYYAASRPDVAYMESVLHDTALSPPGVFEVATLVHYHLATIRLPGIAFVNFHTPYLPALGLTRTQLVDSPAACYPETRSWSQAAFQQRTSSQAVGYGSRRHDGGQCLMLFGQRIPPDPTSGHPFELIDDESLGTGPRRAEVLRLIRSLNVREI